MPRVEEPKRPPKPSGYDPYSTAIDVAASHGWIVELGYTKKGWQLDVFDQEELIARGRSTLAPPHCFTRMGKAVRLALEKGGRLR